jgi:hypothetical protein
LKYIEEYIQKEGPYDGFLGFSQGAMMIPLILSNFETKCKFCILVGPNYLKDCETTNLIKNKIEVPSLFFSGVKVNHFNFEIRTKLFQQNEQKR